MWCLRGHGGSVEGMWWLSWGYVLAQLGGGGGSVGWRRGGSVAGDLVAHMAGDVVSQLPKATG
jgi:hypothetical protein